MNVTEKMSEGLKRELRVVVPATELESRLSKRLDELKNRVQLKGFRPGKVPVAHLRRMYGRSVMAEIVQETVDETTRKALEDRNERPAAQPELTLTEDKNEIEALMRGDADLAYTLAFEVLPAIPLPDMKAIVVERQAASIDEADVEDAVKRIAEQNRPFSDKAAGAVVETGDRVTMDYVGRVGGEVFEGGSDEGATIDIGSGRFVPGFEDQLIGAKAGDERKVTVTFPADYPAKHLAGKEAVFDVKVTGIAAPGEVTLDDEFAKTLGMESMDALRDAIRDQIRRDFAARGREKFKRALLDALDEAVRFELPASLVEREFEGIWRQVTADLERAGKSFADEDTTEDKAREEYRAIAERRVRLGLVLAEVGEKNDIKVSDEEMSRGLMQRVRQFPGQEQQVWEFYQKNPAALAEIRAPLFEDKVVDYLAEIVTVNDKEVSKDTLFADPEDEQKAEDKPKSGKRRGKAAKAGEDA